MFTLPWIISIAGTLISFLGIVFGALFFAEPVDEHKFSFMRIFPFEVSVNSKRDGKLYNYSTYLFSGMCFTPIFVIVEKTSLLSALNPLSILLTCFMGLAAISFVFLNIFNATHVKPHLTIFTIFASLTLLSAALIFARGLTSFTIMRNNGRQEYLFLITEILAGLNAIFVLIIILNPKLMIWAKLDCVDGKYVRPKKFPLAYSEWGILLALLIDEILLFVQLLVK